MQISDEGIIIELRKYHEQDAIIWIFSKKNGVFSGIIKSFQSKSKRFTCQLGNHVSFIWKARLAEHLGSVQIELITPISSKVINSKLKITKLSSICSLLYLCLPERLPEEYLYEKLLSFLDNLRENESCIKAYILLEISVLTELGYGLDLTRCVASDSEEDLIYISPKSGKAVSRISGEPYKDLLFPLPSFFTDHSLPTSESDIITGLKITSYFLNKFVFSQKNIKQPNARERLEEIYNRKIN